MGKYPHGTFTWTDIQVPDQAAGRDFYGKIFGWEFQESPMPGDATYSMALSDGKVVAAISPQMPEQAGMPPVWNSYVTVDHVDKLAAQVGELGGTLIMEPFDVMEDGRMAVIQDPTGGIVSLWEAKSESGQGAQIFNVPVAMTWNELNTRDAEAAQAFYGALLGWEFEQVESPATYFQINNADRMNGGMIVMDENWPADIPAHWMVYFTVEDCTATVEAIEKNQGSVLVPPTDIPAGTLSVVRDPQGAGFTVISYPEDFEATQPI